MKMAVCKKSVSGDAGSVFVLVWDFQKGVINGWRLADGVMVARKLLMMIAASKEMTSCDSCAICNAETVKTRVCAVTRKGNH